MEPMLGQIQAFGFNFAPRGWMQCAGQLLPIAQWQALFSLLGTTYGGDGRTTFALPDLRGRASLGMGHGPGLSDVRIGEAGGRETVTLTTNELPAHSHPVSMDLKSHQPASGSAGAVNSPAPTAGPAKISDGYSTSLETTLAAGAVTGNITTSNTGGSRPVDIRTPYLGLNWCIAVQGIFPSRG